MYGDLSDNVPPEVTPPGDLPPETPQSVQQALQQVFERRPASSAFTTRATAGGRAPRPWPHWDYEPDEWALFDKVDWQRARRDLQLIAGIGSSVLLLVVAILATIVFLLRRPATPSTTILVIIPAFLLVTMLIFLLVPAAHSYNEARKRFRARQTQEQPHKVTFSEKGVWEDGTHFTFNGTLVILKSIKLTTRPTTLHFTISTPVLGSSSAGHSDTVRVLVPRGHEAEAELLLQRYYSEVINAKKKTRSPREPA